jgi:RNA polymerase-binding transcription factor DksA
VPLDSGVAGNVAFVSDITNESVGAIEATLRDVDRALDQLRDGRYGECDVCGAPIDEVLLVADPLRATCTAHPTLRD